MIAYCSRPFFSSTISEASSFASRTSRQPTGHGCRPGQRRHNCKLRARMPSTPKDFLSVCTKKTRAGVRKSCRGHNLRHAREHLTLAPHLQRIRQRSFLLIAKNKFQRDPFWYIRGLPRDAPVPCQSICCTRRKTTMRCPLPNGSRHRRDRSHFRFSGQTIWPCTRPIGRRERGFRRPVFGRGQSLLVGSNCSSVGDFNQFGYQSFPGNPQHGVA